MGNTKSADYRQARSKSEYQPGRTDKNQTNKHWESTAATPKITLSCDADGSPKKMIKSPSSRSIKKSGSQSGGCSRRASGSETPTPKAGARSPTMGSHSQPNIKQKNPMASNLRTIIKSCFDNTHEDISERVFRRILDKREDFGVFRSNFTLTQWTELCVALKRHLESVVININDMDEVQHISEEYGAYHVQFRANGFKPDFFAAMADAVTTECIYLDGATHGPTDTLMAWSQLSTLMFSSVRDGYYAEVRKQRRRLSNISGSHWAKTSTELSIDSSTTSTHSTSPAPGDRNLLTPTQTILPPPTPGAITATSTTTTATTNAQLNDHMGDEPFGDDTTVLVDPEDDDRMEDCERTASSPNRVTAPNCPPATSGAFLQVQFQ